MKRMVKMKNILSFPVFIFISGYSANVYATGLSWSSHEIEFNASECIKVAKSSLAGTGYTDSLTNNGNVVSGFNGSYTAIVHCLSEKNLIVISASHNTVKQSEVIVETIAATLGKR